MQSRSLWTLTTPVGATPRRLTMGTETPSPTPAEEREWIAVLRATIEHYLPDFAKGVNAAANGDTMVLHQDAFAAGYDNDGYTLLGMAIKYAGLRGIIVNVIGKNHDTF